MLLFLYQSECRLWVAIKEDIVPAAVPISTKTIVNPSTKNKERSRALLLSDPLSLSLFVLPAAKYEMYTGRSGSTQGDKKDTIPSINVMKYCMV